MIKTGAIPVGRLAKILPALMSRLGRSPSIQAAKSLAPLLGRTAAWGTAGGLYGYNIAPRFGGFMDNPDARAMTALIDAAAFGMLPGLAGKHGGRVLPLIEHLYRKNPRALAAAPVALITGEMPGWITATLQRQRESAKEQAEAERAIADAQKATAEATAKASIPEMLQRVVKSPITAGAGGGAATAGLGSIITGLARQRTLQEEKEDLSRPRMIERDFLRYLLPAMVAGGVIGSLRTSPAAR